MQRAKKPMEHAVVRQDGRESTAPSVNARTEDSVTPVIKTANARWKTLCSVIPMTVDATANRAGAVQRATGLAPS
jgi:hypothetical protein